LIFLDSGKWNPVKNPPFVNSNPATSTPRDIVNQCSRGFAFPAGFPLSSGLQPPGLQWVAEALCCRLENTTSENFRKFPVFSSGNFAGLKNVGGFRLLL
jgi:hypothetical protein